MLELIDYKWALAGIAALISFCNMSFYLYGTVKGNTKPHFYTWIIWGLVAATVAAGQTSDNAGAGTALTIMAAFNCFLIALFSLKFGSKDIKRSDKACLVACVIGLCLWPLTNTPLWSIIIVTTVDLIGYIPTIRKSFKHPHEESIILFCIFLVSVTLGLLALENYTVITTIYFIAMNTANAFMLLFLIVRRKQLGYKIFA